MSIDKIIKAAELSGFNLEFKTKKVLDELYLKCHLNSLYRLHNEIIEIDLIAQDQTNKHLVIECKGSSTDSSLILIQEQELQRKKLIERIELNEFLRISQFPSLNDNYITFTGDFFDDKFKRKSKDDTKNNFYKAQEQINNAIFLYSNNLAQQQREVSIQFILPLIVTNAQIYVVNFESSPTLAKNCRWAFQRIKNTHNFGLPIILDYLVPVVNINYLKDFFVECRESQTGGYLPGKGEINPT